MKLDNVICLADYRDEQQLVTTKRVRGELVQYLLRRREPSTVTDDRRVEDRIKFPIGKHPVLIVQGVPFRVLDISKTGAKFVGSNLTQIHLAAVVSAKILFKGKRDILVRAKVVRIVGDLIALHFEEPLLLPDFAAHT